MFDSRSTGVGVTPIAGHPTITAAEALGPWHSALHHQVALLERASGGPLVNRRLRPAGTTVLTPLGEQLRRQPATTSASSPNLAHRDARRQLSLAQREALTSQASRPA